MKGVVFKLISRALTKSSHTGGATEQFIYSAGGEVDKMVKGLDIRTAARQCHTSWELHGSRLDVRITLQIYICFSHKPCRYSFFTFTPSNSPFPVPVSVGKTMFSLQFNIFLCINNIYFNRKIPSKGLM